MSHVTGHIIEFSEQIFFVPGEKYNSKSTLKIMGSSGPPHLVMKMLSSCIALWETGQIKSKPVNRCINLVVVPLKTSLLNFLPVAIFIIFCPSLGPQLFNFTICACSTFFGGGYWGLRCIFIQLDFKFSFSIVICKVQHWISKTWEFWRLCPHYSKRQWPFGLKPNTAAGKSLKFSGIQLFLFYHFHHSMPPKLSGLKSCWVWLKSTLITMWVPPLVVLSKLRTEIACYQIAKGPARVIISTCYLISLRLFSVAVLSTNKALPYVIRMM